jgi:hypothetical protein
MSYLSPLRLHFAGKFQAAISTINNDPLHYDTANFKPQYQEMQTGSDPDQLNGWFNPRGSGDWRLIECAITSAWLTDETEAAEDDPILSAIVADSDRLAPAKLVDIDPEQQMVSTIWGLEVRIATPMDENLLCGHFVPIAFMDIWDRAQGRGHSGDGGAGAMYQSVLTHLEWGDVGSSPFLTDLREASGNGLLSIKFNVDGINLAFTSPNFTLGRIVGTIGPTADEPHHFVAGRQFTTGPKAGTSGFFTPANGINSCAAVVDRRAKRIYLDLGNALPTATPGGPPVDLGDITLFQAPPPLPTQQPLAIGQLPATTYTNPDWYERTAGVLALPPDRSLTEAELDRVENNPLVIAVTPGGGPPTMAISEPPGGVFVRADQFVFRLNPDEEAVVSLRATRFGRPYAHAPVVTVRYSDQLQPFSPSGEAPMVATPDTIEFPVRTVTDDQGIATLAVRAADPGTPRDYLDGQVYGLYPVLEETIISPANPYPFNQWAFITLLVWSGFEPDEPPTWFGTIHPILQQYANLYPVMNRFLDLGNYDSVCDNLQLLELSFALDVDHPNSMPVTRDLSAAKRAAILRWLRERGDDGKPRKGTPPPRERVSAVTPPEAPDQALRPALPPPRVPPQQGGKASAASRRLVANGPKAGVADVDLSGVKP